MEYHKDQFSFTDQMVYLQAPLAVQAAHQWLIRHCARRETGGLIVDCQGWKDREWALATSNQIRARDVQAVVAAGLAVYRGQTLEVFGYDQQGEKALTVKRSQDKHGSKGSEYGKLGGRPPKEKPPQETPSGGKSETPIHNPPSPVQSSPYHTSPLHPVSPVPDPSEQDITSGPARTTTPGAKPQMGILELRQIPHLKIKDSAEHPTWLACLNDVGKDTLARAAHIVARDGKVGWCSIVCPLAYQLERERTNPPVMPQQAEENHEDVWDYSLGHPLHPLTPGSPSAHLAKRPRKTITSPTTTPSNGATKP